MEVLGNLDPTLPENVLRENLNYVKDIYLNAIFGSPQEIQNAVKSGRMTQQQADDINRQRGTT
jgi:hypothetical protein